MTFQSIYIGKPFTSLNNAFSYQDIFIQYYGYEVEVHYVTTEDGYVLTVYRCWSKSFASQNRKPVMVQHGIQSTSDVFVMNHGNQSLGNFNEHEYFNDFCAYFFECLVSISAYFLADRGYDVWLPNSRGSTYSRKHLSKNPDYSASGFWNFTFTEMGIYDHPAVIDYILNQTGYSKLNYIGHSQGTTTLLVLLSLKPEYNTKICIASLMAPIAYIGRVGLEHKNYYQSFLFL